MFPDKAKADLAAKLPPSAVKSREQGGSKSATSRLARYRRGQSDFGFDNWNRETLDVRCVSEREREIGKLRPQAGA